MDVRELVGTPTRAIPFQVFLVVYGVSHRLHYDTIGLCWLCGSPKASITWTSPDHLLLRPFDFRLFISLKKKKNNQSMKSSSIQFHINIAFIANLRGPFVGWLEDRMPGQQFVLGVANGDNFEAEFVAAAAGLLHPGGLSCGAPVVAGNKGGMFRLALPFCILWGCLFVRLPLLGLTSMGVP